MIKGIGIDIIDIKRIRNISEKFGEKFFQRIFTDNEINYCKSYSKSIGTGISKDFGWKDIEILNDNRGKPYITHIKENDYSKYKYHISISHTDEYACAVVTCED